MTEIPTFIKVDDDPFTRRTVRQISQGTVWVSDGLNLTPDEIDQTQRLAGKLVALSKPNLLYPLFVSRLETEKVMKTPGSIWRKTATDLLDVLLQAKQCQADGFSENALKELNLNIKAVSAEIDDLIRGFKSIRKFHADHGISNGRKIKGKCRGVDVAKIWLESALIVAKKALDEHPELFPASYQRRLGK